MRYKVIEISPVDESTIEEALNAWTGRGWEFDRIVFVQQDGVRRPSMAYLFFLGEATKPTREIVHLVEDENDEDA